MLSSLWIELTNEICIIGWIITNLLLNQLCISWASYVFLIVLLTYSTLASCLIAWLASQLVFYEPFFLEKPFFKSNQLILILKHPQHQAISSNLIIMDESISTRYLVNWFVSSSKTHLLFELLWLTIFWGPKSLCIAIRVFVPTELCITMKLSCSMSCTHAQTEILGFSLTPKINQVLPVSSMNLP